MLARASFIAILAVPALAFGSGLGEVKDPNLASVAKRASDYLLSHQLRSGGWAWQASSTRQAKNFGGLVAEALLASYEQTGDQRFLDSAKDYAAQLKAKFKASPRELPFKPDIEFLVRLTEVTGEVGYANTASAWFAVVKNTSPRGKNEVARIMKGRKGGAVNLTGYDVALGIRAALAVEDYAYARELGAAALGTKSKWLKDPNSAYGLVSRAALLDALVSADRKGFSSSINTLARDLRGAQTENGSWNTNETQATAYATRALARLGDRSSTAAARRGGKWLEATVLRKGEWADFNDGLPEPFVGEKLNGVQAEALSAVIFASQI